MGYKDKEWPLPPVRPDVVRHDSIHLSRVEERGVIEVCLITPVCSACIRGVHVFGPHQHVLEGADLLAARVVHPAWNATWFTQRRESAHFRMAARRSAAGDRVRGEREWAGLHEAVF